MLDKFLKKYLLNDRTLVLMLVLVFFIVGLVAFSTEEKDSEIQALAKIEAMLKDEAPAAGIDEDYTDPYIKIDKDEEIILED